MSAAEDAPALILTAIPEERAAIARRLAGGPAIVVATGDGPRRASRGAAEAIGRHRPKAVFGAGVAGALTPGLAVGDILASARVLDGAGEAPPPSRRLLEAILAAPGARAGTLLTLERPAVTAGEKALLASSTGAPAACDMESAAWARAASARGIPYVVVRAVSETADVDLPDYLLRCYDADSGIRRSRVILHALARPASLPSLLAMRRRMRESGERLAAFVEHFLASAL